MIRDWFWQLQAAERGPDWYFSASFAQADAERLAALARQHPLAGFEHYRVKYGLCARHHDNHSYDLYIDQRNYAKLAANFESERPQNIWLYHTVAVCGGDLTIERGYGGYEGQLGTAETSLLAMIAQAADLTLLDWQVAYGGGGYAGGQVASGTTATDLLSYLRNS